MSERIPQLASDAWEAVYYPNPIPLSSRCLLGAALLFDRLHVPGVSIPPSRIGHAEKPSLREYVFAHATDTTETNLGLWALEQPDLADFIHLPDQEWTKSDMNSDAVHRLLGQLLDDTYGEGTSSKMEGVIGAYLLKFPDAEAPVLALAWPQYQARALQHAHNTGLPLISDDPRCIPPLPPHPSLTLDTKGVAQQLAMEALSLVLPPFRSVDPAQVAEFRSEVQPLTRPFRVEMIRLTAALNAAISAGTNDDDLRQMCKRMAESTVLPALNDLARQLADPVKPWHKIAIDMTEVALATAGAAVTPVLTIAWAILRAAKIASEYVDLYTDREGKKKSGLSFLLKVREATGTDKPEFVSDWDKRDWRCTGTVYVPDPGAPLTPENQAVLASPAARNRTARTMRRLEQTKSFSAMWLESSVSPS